ncbi:MAG: hypothetical protein PHI86_03470 [Candidatus Omnitrophica bacterium]|nr:hypothetical protein [Candidatus Omnitrophota bacterium]HOX54636.1 hypothetical protein [Candidatus Omnitrophota bacterium]
MYYTKITIFENNRRIQQLYAFIDLIGRYFQNTRHDGFSFELIENEEALTIRMEIDRILTRIYRIVIASGVNPVIQYTPPPAIGGYIRDIDVIHNIFNLSRFEIRPTILLDYIYRAIGIYEDNSKSALIRTFNPFFWLGLLLDYIVSLPFRFMGIIGFNQNKVESSFIGKIVKGILYLITVFASFLTILHLLGLLDNFKNYFSSK